MTKPIIDSGNEKITEQLTNEVLHNKFATEIGQKALIQREIVEGGDLKEQLRLVLEDIGKDIQNIGQIPKGMEYCGSVAVHIYRAPTIGMVAYYNQLSLANCPEQLAGPAVADLKQAMIENYGHKRQKKRSGF